jgi:hypothetical protein
MLQYFQLFYLFMLGLLLSLYRISVMSVVSEVVMGNAIKKHAWKQRDLVISTKVTEISLRRRSDLAEKIIDLLRLSQCPRPG